MIEFPTKLTSIEKRIQAIDPIRYAQTRNHKSAALTYLGPYISRGVISTNQVFKYIKTLGLKWWQIEKLVQELAWRDYWQQVYIAKLDEIHQDLKHKQSPVQHYQMPTAIVEANTGIEAVDIAIKKMYNTGYMHNHMRMYVAALCCNIAQAHWKAPAEWMYSYLLDGDIASNTLSWQWVAGAFSNKKYYANQENINTFFESTQQGTFLDVEYSQFENLPIPSVLKESRVLQVVTKLPERKPPVLKEDKKTLVYNYYNLDPYWCEKEDVQRILLLEPSFFQRYSVQQRSIDFILNLADNIPDIELVVGEFSELLQHVSAHYIFYKEHPTNAHYLGTEIPRDWMSSINGYFSSFFAFWKKCKKEICTI